MYYTYMHRYTSFFSVIFIVVVQLGTLRPVRRTPEPSREPYTRSLRVIVWDRETLACWSARRGASGLQYQCRMVNGFRASLPCHTQAGSFFSNIALTFSPASKLKGLIGLVAIKRCSGATLCRVSRITCMRQNIWQPQLYHHTRLAQKRLGTRPIPRCRDLLPMHLLLQPLLGQHRQRPMLLQWCPLVLRSWRNLQLLQPKFGTRLLLRVRSIRPYVRQILLELQENQLFCQRAIRVARAISTSATWKRWPWSSIAVRSLICSSRLRLTHRGPK